MDIVLIVLMIVLIVAVVSFAIDVQRSLREKGDDGLQAEVVRLVAAQQALAGQVGTVTKNQLDSSRALTESFGKSQAELTEALSDRLAKVEAEMNKNLASSSKETAESLAGLKERLETIDKAQENIKALSEQVVSIRHILDDNPARGAFGEVQLADLVMDLLPPSAYEMQAPISDGKRVDCLIKLPNAAGPIPVDAKFPLVAYQLMHATEDKTIRERAAKQLASDTIKHIRDIADKYLNAPLPDGQTTADHGLMFIPSEAVYSELHANHPSVIDESHKLKVYLVAPTTLMATLNTVQAVLRGEEMRQQASEIQQVVGLMLKDVSLLGTRVEKLDKHFDLASRDIKDIKTSSDRIVGRGTRIGNVELGEAEESQAALESGSLLDDE